MRVHQSTRSAIVQMHEGPEENGFSSEKVLIPVQVYLDSGLESKQGK